MDQLASIIEKSVVTHRMTSIGEMYVAGTGIHVNTNGSAAPYFVGGFSCKKTREEAVLVARFECKERAFAMFDFRNDTSDGYPLYSFSQNIVKGMATPDEVMLRPGSDAVGLAIRVSRKDAIVHAANEILERALLGKIFYCELPIALISKETIGDHLCYFYTTADKQQTGFVMAVLVGRDHKFLTLGASRDDSIRHAINKSRAEAIMLADNILAGKSTKHIVNKHTRQRMASQTDAAMILKRLDFLENGCVKSIPVPTDSCSIEGVISLCGGSDISYCVLAESESMAVVRAVATDFPTLADLRLNNLGSMEASIDFVC
ncbi:hypothetical protein V8G57_18175 [Collimonas sp. H4R21]|uniref:YcaO domain-containing protein n=1 Tax=Collimonas rhizosphaerae TaxID=3126357 RepID=A0ABU9PZ76_9BURK